jgi:hypothetical protein
MLRQGTRAKAVRIVGPGAAPNLFRQRVEQALELRVQAVAILLFDQVVRGSGPPLL